MVTQNSKTKDEVDVGVVVVITYPLEEVTQPPLLLPSSTSTSTSLPAGIVAVNYKQPRPRVVNYEPPVFSAARFSGLLLLAFTVLGYAILFELARTRRRRRKTEHQIEQARLLLLMDTGSTSSEEIEEEQEDDKKNAPSNLETRTATTAGIMTVTPTMDEIEIDLDWCHSAQKQHQPTNSNSAPVADGRTQLRSQYFNFCTENAEEIEVETNSSPLVAVPRLQKIPGLADEAATKVDSTHMTSLSVLLATARSGRAATVDHDAEVSSSEHIAFNSAAQAQSSKGASTIARTSSGWTSVSSFAESFDGALDGMIRSWSAVSMSASTANGNVDEEVKNEALYEHVVPSKDPCLRRSSAFDSVHAAVSEDDLVVVHGGYPFRSSEGSKSPRMEGINDDLVGRPPRDDNTSLLEEENGIDTSSSSSALSVTPSARLEDPLPLQHHVHRQHTEIARSLVLSLLSAAQVSGDDEEVSSVDRSLYLSNSFGLAADSEGIA